MLTTRELFRSPSLLCFKLVEIKRPNAGGKQGPEVPRSDGGGDHPESAGGTHTGTPAPGLGARGGRLAVKF